jgi:secreted trypsin-like serine protease
MAFQNNRWILAGVTSYGEGCARAGYPGLYTRISAFKSYIQSIVGNAGQTKTSSFTKEITTTAKPTKSTEATTETRPPSRTTAAMNRTKAKRSF